MAYTFEDYRKAIRALAANDMQVVMVCSLQPGIGVVHTAVTELEKAGRGHLEIRCDMLTYWDDFTTIPFVGADGKVQRTPRSPFLELFEKAKAKDEIIILSGIDVFFRDGVNKLVYQQLMDAVKTGVRMVWIGGKDFMAVCNDRVLDKVTA